MSAPAEVLVVDSRRRGYVETPDLEQRELGSVGRVRLVRVDSGAELGGEVGRVDGVISWHHVGLDAEVIARMERCRGIVRAAVGYDNIDLEAARRRGIPVCNVPDYGTEEVADHTWALLLALARRIRALDRHCRAGGWDWRTIRPARRLRGETLGIVGFGRIGAAVARRAHAFGVQVGFYDPLLPNGVDKAHGVRRFERLSELIKASGMISIHVSLTEETRGLFGARELAALDGGKVLVNTSRGPVVDNDALLAALAEGRVGGLGLDVVDGEPDVPEELLRDDRVLLTAHSAFYSDVGLEELRVKAARTLLNLLLGRRDRNVVNGVHPERIAPRQPTLEVPS